MSLAFIDSLDPRCSAVPTYKAAKGSNFKTQNAQKDCFRWDLKYVRFQILNGPKEVNLGMGPDFKWARLFEVQINGRHFVKNHLKSGQKI